MPEFFDFEKSAFEFWAGMAIALFTAMLTSGLGLAVGTWLRSVRR